ncbi:uncharacterized protein [Oryctolagus cuniculus]|uniref:uncharacterized protein n=1 Tax=Oryctolagus cuniculus TaxID=9986 RepID=UPI00387A2E32
MAGCASHRSWALLAVPPTTHRQVAQAAQAPQPAPEPVQLLRPPSSARGVPSASLLVWSSVLGLAPASSGAREAWPPWASPSSWPPWASPSSWPVHCFQRLPRFMRQEQPEATEAMSACAGGVPAGGSVSTGQVPMEGCLPPPLCSRSPSCPLPRDDAGGQTGGPRRGLSGPQNCENHDSCSSLSARLRCNASALAREASVLRLGPALRAPSSRTLHLQKEKAHSRSECWNDRQGGAGGRAGSRRLTGGAEPGAGRDNTHRGQCGLWPHVRVSLGPSHRLPAMDPAAELPETLCSPSPPGGGACRCFRVRHQEAPAGGSSPLDRGGRGMLGYRGPVSIATGGPSRRPSPRGRPLVGFRLSSGPPSARRHLPVVCGGRARPRPQLGRVTEPAVGVNTRLFTLPASRALRGGGQGEPRGTGF